MKSIVFLTGALFVWTLFALSSCSTHDDKGMTAAAPAASAPAKAEAKAAPAATAQKAPAKAKVEKVRGDVGLLDVEKNYVILVTKEGKLITLDFDAKAKAVQVTPTPGKVSDIGLGSSATVTYQTANDKNVATVVEFKAAKGGD